MGLAASLARRRTVVTPRLFNHSIAAELTCRASPALRAAG